MYQKCINHSSQKLYNFLQTSTCRIDVYKRQKLWSRIYFNRYCRWWHAARSADFISFYQKSRLNSLLKLYCWVFTTLNITISVISLSLKLCYMDYKYCNFISMSFYFVSTITLIYYSIKCLLHQDLKYIFDNINYVDQSLETLHVNVPHTHNTVECRCV